MKYLDKVNSPQNLKKFNIHGLEELSKDIRKFLLENISNTGGHLSSNLGVVELTIALHYCFNSPVDKMVWDVGHQTYVHKILTGRKDRFDTLRKFNGLSGFPKNSESSHDFFDTGHSSTSISSALGLAVSRDLKGEDNKVISIVGDGSMTGGLVYEALNNAGSSNINLIVVLNDNQMSISENVGAISKYFNDIRTDPKYIEAKSDVNKMIHKVPVVGDTVSKLMEKAKDGLKYLFVPGIMFEEMGFKYIGPIDGHNINELVTVFNNVKKMHGPILLHVHTKKGKGYKLAEKDPLSYHGVEKFDIKTGLATKTKVYDTYADVFGKRLIKLAEENEKIVAVTAAMPDGTGLKAFKEKFPERFFDVGIAECHAVVFAGGMARAGLIPVVAIYSTFLQRAYDQIVHDVCLQNAHVIFAIDRAGIVGADGESHQGVFDISYLSHIPNMTVMAPKNKKEAREMLCFATKHKGPISLRYPRGSASLVLDDHFEIIEYGKSELIVKGSKIALISFGSIMENVYEVYKLLVKKGENPTLINARFASPIDINMVKQLKEYEYIFTFEDHVKTGGFGSILLNYIVKINFTVNNFYTFALQDVFIPQGTKDELYKMNGLDVESIYNSICKQINN